LYDKFIKALPIDDLYPRLVSAGVITGMLKEKVDANPIACEKTKLMLDKMLVELSVEVPDRFKKLIEVMEKFVEDENDVTVKRLLQDIYVFIGAPQPVIRPGPSLLASGWYGYLYTSCTLCKYCVLPYFHINLNFLCRFFA